MCYKPILNATSLGCLPKLPFQMYEFLQQYKNFGWIVISTRDNTAVLYPSLIDYELHRAVLLALSRDLIPILWTAGFLSNLQPEKLKMSLCSHSEYWVADIKLSHMVSVWKGRQTCSSEIQIKIRYKYWDLPSMKRQTCKSCLSIRYLHIQ